MVVRFTRKMISLLLSSVCSFYHFHFSTAFAAAYINHLAGQLFCTLGELCRLLKMLTCRCQEIVHSLTRPTISVYRRVILHCGNMKVKTSLSQIYPLRPPQRALQDTMLPLPVGLLLLILAHPCLTCAFALSLS